MKTLKLLIIKLTIQLLLLILLAVTGCSQSEKDTTSIESDIQTTRNAEKPKVDIQTAVITGNLEAVKQHIESGTDINQKEPISSATPLMTAVTFNKPDIVKALIDAKVNLSITNNDGSTALHTAAFFGRIEIVQMLIDAKADKTLRNNFGATPRETVMGNFAEVKPFYDMLTLQLQPMGFVLDMEELKEARPVVAMMLQ